MAGGQAWCLLDWNVAPPCAVQVTLEGISQVVIVSGH